jgi:hypothetical protein
VNPRDLKPRIGCGVHFSVLLIERLPKASKEEFINIFRNKELLRRCRK